MASKLLGVIAIDFTVLDKASDGRENVLVVTDVFSKFAQAYYQTHYQRAKYIRLGADRKEVSHLWCTQTVQ